MAGEEVRDATCGFCERLAGRDFFIPIVEGDHVVALVANRQRSRGSVIVIPRRHLFWLPEFTVEERNELLMLVRRLAHAMERAYDPDGLHVWQGGRLPDGDSRPHFHLRMCPRYEGEPYSFGGNDTLDRTPLAERHDVRDRLQVELARIPAGRF